MVQTAEFTDSPVAGATILVVDDSRVTQLAVRAPLEKEYRVLCAASGEEALALAAGEPRPELILLDVMMPGMDGYEVLRRLRDNPATQDIPVIFITALLEEDEEASGLRLGAVDYLIKPVRASILLARVRNHVELKRSRDLLRGQNRRLEAHVAERTRSLHAALQEQQLLNQRLEEAQRHLLQSEKMAALGQLAAGIAHEINNPVSFVNSNLGSLDTQLRELLEVVRAGDLAAARASDTPEYADYQRLKRDKEFDYLCDDLFQIVAESKEGVERVRRIVTDLKGFSRASDDAWEWTDLHAGIDSTLNIVWNELKYKCAVHKRYATDLPRVRCLPSEVNQIVMNLLVNAGQAIENQGEITIETARLDGDRVLIRVSDTGQGIPADRLEKIFEPFYTTKPVGQGTGLGLSLAWNIVAKHRGRIEVDSRLGQGTRFTVTLPIDALPQEAGV